MTFATPSDGCGRTFRNSAGTHAGEVGTRAARRHSRRKSRSGTSAATSQRACEPLVIWARTSNGETHRTADRRNGIAAAMVVGVACSARSCLDGGAVPADGTTAPGKSVAASPRRNANLGRCSECWSGRLSRSHLVRYRRQSFERAAWRSLRDGRLNDRVGDSVRHPRYAVRHHPGIAEDNADPAVGRRLPADHQPRRLTAKLAVRRALLDELTG